MRGASTRAQAPAGPGAPAAAAAPAGASGASSELLALDAVSVRIAGREILHDVTFAIRPGEFTGLIGPNGAGKTTILRAILGLQQPSSGTVRIGGSPRTRRNTRIGYVPQKLVVDPDMPLRVRDVVALGIDGHRLGFRFPSRARRELVDETLRAVGADGYADARVGELSGGEQQRVLIAHALISEPRLLLLDEPLANLDIRSEHEIVSLLERLVTGHRIAVLISAHDMNPLLRAMDRIVYVAGGRAAVGSTEEVVRPDVLSRLYGQHVDVLRVHDRILVVAAPDGEAASGTASGGDTPGDGAPGDGAPGGEDADEAPDRPRRVTGHSDAAISELR